MSRTSPVSRRSLGLIVAVALLAVLPGFSAGAAVTCNGLTPTFFMTSTYFEGSDAEDVVIGTTGDDVIDTSGGNDTICAGEGKDLVDGGDGDDWIDGGSKGDTLIGGPGFDQLFGKKGKDVFPFPQDDDFIHGGLGNDTLDASIHSTAITVDLDAETASYTATGLPDLEVKSIEKVLGTSVSDTISGSEGPDRLIGNAGADVIDGRGGDDVLFGNAGGDTLNGGDGVNDLRGGNGLDDTCTFGPLFNTCELPHGHAILEGAPDGLQETLEALLAWMAVPTDPQPDMPSELATHLEAATVTAPFEMTFEAATADLAITDAAGTTDTARVAVATAGDCVFLLVEEVPDSGDWTVVGTRITEHGSAAWYGEDARFVVVLGSDARPTPLPLRSADPWRNAADSVHLLTASVSEQAGAAVGITRHVAVDADYEVVAVDSAGFIAPNLDEFLAAGGVVDANGSPILPISSSDRINDTMMIPGGPAHTTAVIADFTGLPVEGYLVSQFGGGQSPGDGFIDLIDAMGGLDIDLETAIDYFGGTLFEEYWPVGPQTLDGAESLKLARDRFGQTLGDFDRQYHGSLIIEAALFHAQSEGWLGIPDLLDLMLPFVATDLDAAALLTLAATAFEMDPDQVATFTAPAWIPGAAQDLVTGALCPPATCSAFTRFVSLSDHTETHPTPDDPAFPDDPDVLWADLVDGFLGS